MCSCGCNKEVCSCPKVKELTKGTEMSDLDMFKAMAGRSEFGSYYLESEGKISWEGEEIETIELTMISHPQKGDFKLVFCASDGSYITSLVEDVKCTE